MKLIRELLIICVLMFALAFLFVEGWDRQYEIDLKQSTARVEQMIQEMESSGEYVYWTLPDRPVRGAGLVWDGKEGWKMDRICGALEVGR
jgi:hypothetical protein